MDECLSNLDARLREKMAAELRRIQQTVGITTIYVTHDQHEALAMSDRIAVLHQGGLQQVGTPDDLYHRPRNSLVAASLGPINLFSLAEACQLGLINGLFEPLDDSTTLGVRPEDVWVIPAQAYPAVAQWLKKTIHPADNVNGLLGRVTKVTFLGNVYRYQIELGKYVLQGQILPALLDVVGGHIDQMISGVSPGDRVSVVINPQTWIRFAEESSGSSDNRDYPEI
ncbi:MAG: TOBE domain-containing protein [Rubrivivax sp.]|nr:TOBE domain-containing protein [Rubrivivax sp.]